MLPTEATKYDENDVVDTQVPDTLSYLWCMSLLLNIESLF
jgi:hypothetical protein